MTPPITPPAPAAQKATAPEPSSASRNESRPASSSARRIDTERLRTPWNNQTPEAPLSADGMFFLQLLIPLVDAQPQDSGFGGSGFAFPAPNDALSTQLVEDLGAQLLGQPDGPIVMTLMMPNLGRIHVNASKRDSQWTIELGFGRRGALKRVQPHHSTCRDALAEALGCDIQLSMHEDLDT